MLRHCLRLNARCGLLTARTTSHVPPPVPLPSAAATGSNKVVCETLSRLAGVVFATATAAASTNGTGISTGYVVAADRRAPAIALLPFSFLVLREGGATGNSSTASETVDRGASVGGGALFDTQEWAYRKEVTAI